MKIAQLYGIMMMLISNGFVTRADITRRFGIGERTVRRYIEDLRAADVPVRAETGSHGGYYIPEDYKISVAMFTDEEMDSFIKASMLLTSKQDEKKMLHIIRLYDPRFNGPDQDKQIDVGQLSIPALHTLRDYVNQRLADLNIPIPK